jgi:hypothetical protein
MNEDLGKQYEVFRNNVRKQVKESREAEARRVLGIETHPTKTNESVINYSNERVPSIPSNQWGDTIGGFNGEMPRQRKQLTPFEKRKLLESMPSKIRKQFYSARKEKQEQSKYKFETASPISRAFDSYETSLKRRGFSQAKINAIKNQNKKKEERRKQAGKVMDRAMSDLFGF